MRVAADAETALAIVDVFAPELVVFDYGLPGTDGLQAFAQIVQVSARPPHAVLITGDPSEAVVARAHRLGVRQILCKPFSFAELQGAVKAAVGDVAASAVAGERRGNERRRLRNLDGQSERRSTPTRRARPDAGLQEVPVRPTKVA